MIHVTGSISPDRKYKTQSFASQNNLDDQDRSNSYSERPSQLELKEVERIDSYKRLSQAQKNVSQLETFVTFGKHAQVSNRAYNYYRFGYHKTSAGFNTIQHQDPTAGMRNYNQQNDLIVGAQNVTLNNVQRFGKKNSKQSNNARDLVLKDLPQIKSQTLEDYGGIPQSEQR